MTEIHCSWKLLSGKIYYQSAHYFNAAFRFRFHLGSKTKHKPRCGQTYVFKYAKNKSIHKGLPLAVFYHTVNIFSF